MISIPKVSLSSCRSLEAFVLEHLKFLNVNFYAYTKSYANNSRLTLASDPAYIRLYFSSKYYEVDWLGHDELLKTFADNVITWQYCHEEHVACSLFKEHQKMSGIAVYFVLYFRFDGYSECHTFGTKGELIANQTDIDKEVTIMLNNKALLQRFIQSFKSNFDDIIKQADEDKYRVQQIKKDTQEMEHYKYWGDCLSELENFKKHTKVEKIYLQGAYDKIYLTHEEADMLKMFYYGEKYKDIGDKYDLSVRAIEMRFRTIKDKLKAESKKDLKDLIIKHKVIDLIKVSL